MCYTFANLLKLSLQAKEKHKLTACLCIWCSCAQMRFLPTLNGDIPKSQLLGLSGGSTDRSFHQFQYTASWRMELICVHFFRAFQIYVDSKFRNNLNKYYWNLGLSQINPLWLTATFLSINIIYLLFVQFSAWNIKVHERARS